MQLVCIFIITAILRRCFLHQMGRPIYLSHFAQLPTKFCRFGNQFGHASQCLDESESGENTALFLKWNPALQHMTPSSDVHYDGIAYGN